MERLRRKYDHAVAIARSAGMTGLIVERDGRLFLKGSVRSSDQAARIWRAIKSVASWRNEVVAEILVTGESPKPLSPSFDQHR